MQTLTLNIPDPVLTRIQVSARSHGHSVEEESVELLESATVQFPARLRTKEEADALLAKLERLHKDLSAKGVWMTPTEITEAINQGRE